MARRRKKNKTLEFFIFAVLLIIILYSNISTMSHADETDSQVKEVEINGDLEVHFLDVGQADSIMISCMGEFMIIDAGNNADGPLIVDYLKSLDIDRFKYAVGTHAHEDHIGGMDDIIDNFSVDNFYMPDVVTTTKTFEDVLDALERANVAFGTPIVGDKFTLGSANIEVIYVGTNEKDLNSTSIVLRLDFGNTSFLFTGDATEEVESNILEKNIEADVLKVAHHGSKYSTSWKFLKKVAPKYAIISVGLGNSYGHPGANVLQRLEKAGIQVYRTDEVGTIIAKSDGNKINFETFKTNTNG